MRVKTLVIAGVAAVILFLAVAVVAGAAFLFVTNDSQAQTSETVEVAPVIVEPAVQSDIQVVEPVIQYEEAQFTEKSGCPYSHQAKNQMVRHSEEKVSDDLLTQVAQ